MSQRNGPVFLLGDAAYLGAFLLHELQWVRVATMHEQNHVGQFKLPLFDDGVHE